MAMTLVEFRPGDGTRVRVEVEYISDYPRGADGICAFCHGDPLAGESSPTSDIARFYERSPRAETCPMCLGRPA
jgi:hypothetical protein